MQLVYNINQGVANPGMIADASFDMIESFQAYEYINLGVGVVKQVGSDYVCRLPRANAATIVFSVDLVAADVVSVTVNGVAITPVTYGSSHLATVNAVIAQLLLLTTQVKTAALDATDTTNRTIKVGSIDGLDAITVASIVHGGAGTAAITNSVSSSDVLEGISVSTMAKEETLGTLLVQFKPTEAVPVMRKGKIYVTPEVNVASGDPVYCRLLGDGSTKFAGQFRNTSDSGTAFLVSSAVWKTTAVAGAVAIIEINQP